MLWAACSFSQRQISQQCGVHSQKCGLTGRSTGHFAAGQFWAQKPSPKSARRKVPVSFNVKPHPTPQGQFSRASVTVLSGERQFRFERAVSLLKLLVCGTYAYSSQGVWKLPFSSAGVWPNLALNRTLCGSPGLGSKILAQTRPAAKCRLASTLGILWRSGTTSQKYTNCGSEILKAGDRSTPCCIDLSRFTRLPILC